MRGKDKSERQNRWELFLAWISRNDPKALVWFQSDGKRALCSHCGPLIWRPLDQRIHHPTQRRIVEGLSDASLNLRKQNAGRHAHLMEYSLRGCCRKFEIWTHLHLNQTVEKYSSLSCISAEADSKNLGLISCFHSQTLSTLDTLWVGPKTQKCCLIKCYPWGLKHRGTSEANVSVTSCQLKYLHLVGFWLQPNYILCHLWNPTIMGVHFNDRSKEKKWRMMGHLKYFFFKLWFCFYWEGSIVNIDGNTVCSSFTKTFFFYTWFPVTKINKYDKFTSAFSRCCIFFLNLFSCKNIKRERKNEK